MLGGGKLLDGGSGGEGGGRDGGETSLLVEL